MTDIIKDIRNPVFRELASTAQVIHRGDFGLVVPGGVDLEKFAELIVKECARFIDSHEQIDKYGEAQDTVYGRDVMQHFGVE